MGMKRGKRVVTRAHGERPEPWDTPVAADESMAAPL